MEKKKSCFGSSQGLELMEDDSALLLLPNGLTQAKQKIHFFYLPQYKFGTCLSASQPFLCGHANLSSIVGHQP